MGLNVALVNLLGVVFPLHHGVGFLEALFHIAQREFKVVGDVGAVAHVARGVPAWTQRHVGQGGQSLVDQRGSFLHGILGGQNRGKYFVIYVYERKGLLSQGRTGGRYGGYSVTQI